MDLGWKLSFGCCTMVPGCSAAPAHSHKPASTLVELGRQCNKVEYSLTQTSPRADGTPCMSCCTPHQTVNNAPFICPWLPDGDSQIFRSYVFDPLGFWSLDYGSAMLRCKKFDPFLSLDCTPTPSTLAQSKERKGSSFAIWQPCHLSTLLTCKNLSKAGFVCLAILIASSARFTLRMKAVYVSITDFFENWSGWKGG